MNGSRSWAIAGIVAAAACTSAPEREPRLLSPGGASAVALARAVPSIAAQLEAVTLRRTELGFEAEAVRRPGWSRPPAARVVLPGKGGAAARLETSPDTFVEIAALDDAPVEGREHDGAIVAHTAADVDVVHFGGGARFEEARVLARPALRSFRYRVTLGAALKTVRVIERRVEIADAEGRVRFTMQPPFAVDARGTTITLSPRYDDSLLTIDVDARALTAPIVVDPAWTATTSLLEVRATGSAFRLADGRVLVAGGHGPVLPSGTTAELFDPVAMTWTTAGTNLQRRDEGIFAQLPSGKVLAALGNNFSVALSTAELWSPTTRTWTSAAAPPPGCGPLASAVRLASGRILVAGGAARTFAMTYDEPSNAWAAVGPMKVGRERQAMALLPSNKVFVTSGSTAELYDPSNNSWTLTAPPPRSRYAPTGTLLSTGKILVLGDSSAADLYDPGTNTWSAGAPLPASRSGHLAVVLPTGRVLIAGGAVASNTTSSALLYDPTANTWSSAGAMLVARSSAQVTSLANGDVLVAGGMEYGPGFTGYLRDVEIFSQATSGGSCAADYECRSGFCVDGACCNRACTGPCEACDVSGGVGTCTSIGSGVPHGARTCGSYAQCVSGACPTSCTTDAACATTAYCNGSACVAKKAGGAACAANKECTSGSCADGVCCDRTCGSICEACDVTGKVGTCTTIAGTPRPSRGGCGGPGAGTPCGATCDGVVATACSFPAAGSPTCGANACVDGIETHARTCDGKGACSDVPVSCGAYACGATTCKTTCATKSDCAAAYDCIGGACKPPPGAGESCLSTAGCASGLTCVDGVCCSSSSCPVGSRCDLVGKKGVCAKQNGTPCTAAGECASGQCVDAVCCDAACAGSCEACDVVGKVGTCSPVIGAPHGARTACPASTSVCATASCDGVTRDACKGLPDKTRECATATCTDGTLKSASFCDGAGACGTGTTTSCAPYACAGSSECRTTCDLDRHCAAGFRCAANKCVKIDSGAKCTDDGLGSLAADGRGVSCAPYRCDASKGTCGTACTSSGECAPSNACSSGVCVPVASEPQDEGGCAVRAPRGGSSSVILLALLAAAAIVRRRRALLASALLASCSSRGEQRVAPAPADTTEAALAPIRAASLPTRVSRESRFLDGPAGHGLAGERLRIVSPNLARDPLTIDAGAGVSLAIVSEDSSDVRGVVRGNAVVFANAIQGADVVHVVEADRVEELRVLHAPTAKIASRYRITKGSGVSQVSLRDGLLTAVDRAGILRIVGERPFVVGADGARREASYRLVRDGEAWTLTLEADASGLTPPIVVDPLFRAAAPMPRRRTYHTISAYGSKAIVIGGNDGVTGGLSITDVYDPSTDSWSPGPPSLYIHVQHFSVRLPSGKLLVAHGAGLTQAETFDPTTATWAAAGTHRPHYNGALTPLSNGKVLIAGDLTATADLYDPATNAWTATGNLLTGRTQMVVAALPAAKAIAAGGYSSDYRTLTSTEIYNAGTWSAGPPTVHGHAYAAAVTLPSGKALVIGGVSAGAPISFAELYDPATNTWSGAGAMTYRRSRPAATLLATGKVLVTGSAVGGSAAEVYDPLTNKWSVVGDEAYRWAIEGADGLLANGSVLVTGGELSGSILSSAEVFTQLGAAATCTSAIDCGSLQCVDGVCCDAACSGPCQACNLTGKVGVCSAVDGTPSGSRTCGPYAKCVAGACASTCTSHADCSTGYYCAGSACVPGKATGEACSIKNECKSGQCADGVCCDTACTEQCAACDLPLTKGTCTAHKGAPRAPRAACTVGAGTACGQQCNGFDPLACHYLPAGQPACGTNACVGGVETHASTCDGAGSCSDVPKKCGDYVCGTLTCKTSCAVNADCTVGICVSGVCTTPIGGGQPCVDSSKCSPGLFCTDGVCCTVASCGADASCNNKGVCTKKSGATCAADGECATGYCADGVCCSAPCTGQCQACDVAGSIGTCTPVVGKPHGARAACVDPGDCTARTCDGNDPGKCSGFIGNDRACGAASCKDGEATGAAKCDGAGSCGAAKRTSCEPYDCDTDVCKTGCAANADCAAGYECKESKCVPAIEATCSTDGLSSLLRDGTTTPCAPYRCGTDGRCLRGCAKSDDCAPGRLCEAAECKDPATVIPDTSDSGGCSTGGTPRATTGALIVLLAAVGALRRRRRVPAKGAPR